MKKKILITGASTGIGAEIASCLAMGNTIFVHYNSSQSGANKVADNVAELGGEAILCQSDLRTESGCLQLIEQIENHTGSLDVLINNAGGLVKRRKIEEMDWDLLEEVFALNVFSTMKLAGLCVPLLLGSDDASIINISSIVARHGAAGATPYGAAKGAVDSFTRGLAKELAPEIRVNAIAPGVIETPFHDKVSTPENLRTWAESAPMKRNGKPEHISSAVKFILENDFICGETIDINGGMFMR